MDELICFIPKCANCSDYMQGETSATLLTGYHYGGGGDAALILMETVYAIEGHVVDRKTQNNGKGWCEDVSPTLNTQDKHAVVYALEGNGSRPSHFGSGYSDCGKSFTLNATEHHAVCYDARGNGTGAVSPTITGDHQNRITDYTAILCYNDRRRADYHEATDGIAPAVVAKYGTGGGNTPMVLFRNDDKEE